MRDAVKLPLRSLQKNSWYRTKERKKEIGKEGGRTRDRGRGGSRRREEDTVRRRGGEEGMKWGGVGSEKEEE